MDITNPREPTPVSSVFDDTGGFDALGGINRHCDCRDIGADVCGGRRRRLIAESRSLTSQTRGSPFRPQVYLTVRMGLTRLDKPLLLAVTEELGRTYVVVGGAPDGDTQIIDITNPREPVPALNVFDRTDILLVSSVAPVTEIAGGRM